MAIIETKYFTSLKEMTDRLYGNVARLDPSTQVQLIVQYKGSMSRIDSVECDAALLRYLLARGTSGGDPKTEAAPLGWNSPDLKRPVPMSVVHVRLQNEKEFAQAWYQPSVATDSVFHKRSSWWTSPDREDYFVVPVVGWRYPPAPPAPAPTPAEPASTPVKVRLSDSELAQRVAAFHSRISTANMSAQLVERLTVGFQEWLIVKDAQQ